MQVEAVSTYVPAWRDDQGRAMRGGDEDATTMAVAAAAPLVARPAAGVRVCRVVVITRAPALLEGPTGAIIATALGLAPDVPVEIQLGSGPAVLDALLRAEPGTIVVGVDPETPAGAAAAFTAGAGARLALDARAEGTLPARVRAPGGAPRVCDDPRLLREAGWRQAVGRTGASASGTAVIVGPPASVGSGLGGDRDLIQGIGSHGASAPLFALAALAAAGTDGLLVALEAGTVTSVTVAHAPTVVVLRDEPQPQGAPADRAPASAPPIPASAAAYARAFEAKVGFAAGRCECGAIDLPPRYLCLVCGREDASHLERLPRSGAVYTSVTIHAAVPNRVTPYSLAIIDLDDVDVRYLGPVTGVPPGSVAIGARGRLVLRRIADREVGPDYGWAFIPDLVGANP